MALIEDYALIGDCETAALVGKDGAIDWMCFPRFDSPAAFAALLGREKHGRFRIAPRADVRSVSRCYRRDTLVLETRFETSSGAVTLVDFMPVRTGVADLVRIVRGERGTVDMGLDLCPRFDTGYTAPWFSLVDGGALAIAGPDALWLTTSLPLELTDRGIEGSFTVHEGHEVNIHLCWSPSHLPKPKTADAREVLQRTTEFWQSWSRSCRYEGRYRDAVSRSMITLKALTYAPTGAIIAAPTTSLPEHFGGVRNWDYRYCWLRDATFTLLALMEAGYEAEALAFRKWLLRSTAGKPSQVQIMYGVGGERRLYERELPWLPGFEGSAPVRIGNAAYEQVQLDVFGEVMDVLHQCWRRGLGFDDFGWQLERVMMDFIEDAWHLPDEGIWEVRGGPRHFTHSKVMAWVAVDRAVRAVERYGMEGPVDEWRALRAQIHEDVCRHGYDAERGAFVQFYGSKHLDASLLTLPLVGFLPVTDERIRGTVEAVQRELTRDGFVSRYQNAPAVDGLPSGDAAFLLCSFWLADCLGLMGREREARAIFDQVLAVRNDVGLLSESYDVRRRRLAGNFPQAFSHVGLVTTARLFQREKVYPDERAD